MMQWIEKKMEAEDRLAHRDFPKGAKGTEARYDYSWSGIIGRVCRRAVSPLSTDRRF